VKTFFAVVVATMLTSGLAQAESYQVRFKITGMKAAIDPEVVVPASCQEHLNQGETNSGIYTITPDSTSEPVEVYCDMAIDGGGWMFVNEAGRSSTDIHDLFAEVEGGLHQFVYDLQGISYNQVLVERVNSYWCNSWGSGKPYWGDRSEVSMGIAVDKQFVHYHSGQFSPYRWIMQSYATRGQVGSQPWATNNTTPSNVSISNLGSDGARVKLVPSSTGNTWLEIENYDAFVQGAGGCNDLNGQTFKQRVFIR
jgi:hypothetical protein